MPTTLQVSFSKEAKPTQCKITQGCGLACGSGMHLQSRGQLVFIYQEVKNLAAGAVYQ